MTDLKLCPFCGTPDPYLFHNETEDTWAVACTWCGCRTADRGTQESAVRSWNMRWEQ